jgi:predicted lysophospholipase L1 biosynthesis ABC-type transport system permease subunit
VIAQPLKERIVGDVRRPLLVLIAAVAFVLLVACVNVANLFLIRLSERSRELTVRAALGAGRRRLVQQLFAESLVIAVLGAAAGPMLAGLGLPGLLALAPAGAIPRMDLVRIDVDVLLVTTLLSLLTTVAFGLLPAFRAMRQRGGPGMVNRTVTDRREGLHGALVVAEIALSLILLTGAGLMLQGFLSLRAVDPGFGVDGVLTATVDLPLASYGVPAQANRFSTSPPRRWPTWSACPALSRSGRSIGCRSRTRPSTATSRSTAAACRHHLSTSTSQSRARVTSARWEFRCCVAATSRPTMGPRRCRSRS